MKKTILLLVSVAAMALTADVMAETRDEIAKIGQNVGAEGKFYYWTVGGADFIKTSTGFGTAGAKLSDIELFKKHIGPGVQMKAAGGIHTREEMEAFLAAGCTRLGASAAVKVLKDEFDKEEK